MTLKKLTRYCANCAHFDGDGHCALPTLDALIPGFIADPERVVCEEHEEQEPDQQEAIAKAIEAEKADAERSLYRFARY